jgi:carboxypeptidase C (cathepsin A)
VPDLIDYNMKEFHLSSSAASNLLFVESPAGVGWSYSNTSSDYTIGDAKTGIENCKPPN